MLKIKNLRERIKNNELVFGTFFKTGSLSIVEIIGYAGFDFIVVDCEHSSLGYAEVEDIIRASENVQLPSIIRVASADDQNIFHALDSGAAGVQLPNMSSAEQVRDCTKYTKYYPLGERGLSRAQRAAKFGFWTDDKPYVEYANDNTVVSVHIENTKMVDQIEEICQIEQVDVVFVGPADLSQSLGIPGQSNNPKVVDLAAKVFATAKKYNKAGGIFVNNEDGMKKYIDLGATYILFDTDTSLFGKAAKQAVQSFTQYR